ncbi:MAG: hypothetical protein WC612_01720 [Bdellovibrionales bacterium]|jgi:hypothetical protein
MSKNDKEATILDIFRSAALGVTLLVTSHFISGCATVSAPAEGGLAPQKPATPIAEQTLRPYSNVVDEGSTEVTSYAALKPDQPRVDVLEDKVKKKTDVVITDGQRKMYRVFTTLAFDGKNYSYCVDVGFDGYVQRAVTGNPTLDRSIKQLRDNPPDIAQINALIEKTKSLANKKTLSPREGPMKTVSVPIKPDQRQYDLRLDGYMGKGHVTQVSKIINLSRHRQLNASTLNITTRFDLPTLQDGLPLTFEIRNGKPPAHLTGILMDQVRDSLKDAGWTVSPKINSVDWLSALANSAEAAAWIMTTDFERIAYQRPIEAPLYEAALKKNMDTLLSLMVGPEAKPAKQPAKPTVAPKEKMPTKAPAKPCPKAAPKEKVRTSQIAMLAR